MRVLEDYKLKQEKINIIFDMDGTLIDSAKIAIPAFKKVCPKYEIEIPSDDKITAAIGYANPVFYYKIYPDIDKELLKEFGKDVEGEERTIVAEVNTSMLFEGVKELLGTLVQRKHRMFIASTGDFEHVDDCLRVCDIYNHFEEIHCNKPDKELMVAEIIKKEPKEKWIMIGDRTKDSKAAKHNNILSIGAAYGYCVPEDYGEFDYIIEKPNGLLQIIDDVALSKIKY